MSEPKIIDRIRKLLALSKSSNEHEAAAAAARAADLMAKHQLSEAALADDEELEPVDSHEIDSAGKCVSWRGALANGCAQAFGCRMYWSTGHRFDVGRKRPVHFSRTMVVGRERDVDGVRYMYQLLVREVERLADVCWSETPRYVSARRWKNSFRLGCAGRIEQRLIKQRRATLSEASRDASNSQALIRLDAAEAAVEMHLRGLDLRAGGAPRCGRDGYSDGKAAGDRVNLGGSRQLGKPAEQLK